MTLKQLKPRKALNKAYLKLKPDRDKIDIFKANLIQLLDRIDDTESEEYHKNLISSFLRKTYYEPNHYINTKDRADLVIHNGKNRASSVGVIIETKRPTNKWEMITPDEINAKAFHEHLLKLPFANDSNTLDKRFYGELLHIMGLSESKEGGKKVIGREEEGKRNIGSLLVLS